MNLVIVESPTKARTIGKFLGNAYIIKPSMGHVMDLPKSQIGVDIEHEFKPEFDIIADKKILITELKKLAKEADSILLATDPDREGEAIASNVKDILEGDKKVVSSRFKRIVFHEITESTIKEAVKHPRDIDINLVNAQIARRVLDRLVGYQLSPVLWKKIRRGLSAGRVQSVALRLIVEREREIEKFSKELYWTIRAIFSRIDKSGRPHPDPLLKGEGDQGIEFILVEINGEKVDLQQKLQLYDGEYTYSKTIIDNQKKANSIVIDIKKYNFLVGDIFTKETHRTPYPPFTTSTLQQQAAIRFGLPAKRTMNLAQKLYEEGFITYHRTDSVTMSQVAVSEIRAYIDKEFGKKYIPAQLRVYFAKQKNAQEAHEAIRPTVVGRESSVVRGELGETYAKLYDLIWKRTVASQMSDALIESTTIYADSSNVIASEAKQSLENGIASSSSTPRNDNFPKYRFKANGSVLLFDGFLKLIPLALEDKQLPKFVSDENLTLQNLVTNAHETTPPPRYNDASIIKILEEKGIGRPSTYASIISTLSDRGYVDRQERKFIPTLVGGTVNDFLVTHFSTIDDIPFTAAMEENLDLVANGKKEWHEMMKEFYIPFGKKLKEVENAKRVQIPVTKTDEICPECKKGNLVIRSGKFGKFLSCQRFPECKFTKPFVEETDFFCPKDGGKIIVKKTRKGRRFYGCSNYPNCNFAAWKLEDIKKV
jgi:DNA topoisomerase I